MGTNVVDKMKDIATVNIPLDIDLNEIKTFFNPSPRGTRGTRIALPIEIIKAAEELDGKSMTLREAAFKIIKATYNLKGFIHAPVSIHREGFFHLTLEDYDNFKHYFRVIRFK